jgi:hypothetical protein
MAERSAREVLADHQPFTERIQLRCSKTLKTRIQRAADDCGLAESDWERAVLDSAVELHEERERLALAGVEFDEVAQEPEGETVEEYEARVRADARAIRDERRKADPMVVGGPRPPTRPRPNPRDCVHPPRQRSGPRCTLCGATVSQVRRAGTGAITGRF